MTDNCANDTGQWAQTAQLSGRNFIVILLRILKAGYRTQIKTNGKLNKSILNDTLH